MNQNFMWVCIGHYKYITTIINVGHLMVEPLSFLDLPFHKHSYCICFHSFFYFPHFTTKAWRFIFNGGVFSMVAVLLYNF